MSKRITVSIDLGFDSVFPGSREFGIRKKDVGVGLGT